MELYLARHGDAKSEHEDPERGLSDLGFTNVRKVSRFLSRLIINVDTIFHSNKLRAEQTALEHGKMVNSRSGFQERCDICPMDDIGPMKKEIDKSKNNLMIVGHMPYMGKLISALLCGDENNGTVIFQTGTLVKLIRDPSSKVWYIEWVISPNIC